MHNTLIILTLRTARCPFIEYILHVPGADSTKGGEQGWRALKIAITPCIVSGGTF